MEYLHKVSYLNYLSILGRGLEYDGATALAILI